MTKERVYSKYAQQAAFLMGKQIKLARKNRKWSSSNLIESAGIISLTLKKLRLVI